ncbi:PLANT CADMIUM RESISTANCE 3-like [Brachionus plicatilis]|uniref:PLANT CADMIUM RESISTANCE 3-like n=1 Tax=Brachionus plicatilis TaxID=10195 RepID=A0A3M7RMM2_BRAPC|nr:PLANT CADMIUM RESISTANCE 3-like [Brachionus plicatilis]
MSEFRNGLFDCFGSLPDCLIGYCVPCLEAGLASNAAGQSIVWNALQCFFYPLLVPIMRYQIREEKGIDGNIVNDLAAGWCCPCCAAIQIKREFD